MDYINNSVRKLGSLFCSPPPASTLGKRKADDEYDSNGSVFERLHVKRQSLDPSLSDEEHVVAHTGYITSTHSPTEFSHVDDPFEDVAVSDEVDDHNYPVPQRPQTRKQKRTTTGTRSAATTQALAVTKKADQAMRKNRESVAKPLPTEQEIQDELSRQERQEEHDRKALANFSKKKPRTHTNAPHVFVPDGMRRVSDTSKPKLVPLSQARQNKEQWTIQPNRRARDLLVDNGNELAAMLRNLQEPAYVCRDAEIRNGVEKMMEQIQDFAEEHCSFKISNHKLLRPALKSLPKETVKIIGYIASGGPSGAEGWEDLFLKADKREALVCAIIGNVLSEQVLQHMFFGGTKAQIKEVADTQLEHRHKDGFDRNALYASTIRSFLTSTFPKGKTPTDHPPSTLHLPANFSAHVNHTTAALFTHLKPLLSLKHLPPLNPSLSPPSEQSAFDLTNTFPALHALVVHAGLLSLHMRLDARTAYHLTPIFKDTRFSKADMSCINQGAMIAMHPLGTGDADGISKTEQKRRNTLSAEESKRVKSDQGLVQICLFPGVTAYRLGGWEANSSKAVDADTYEGKGVRERRLTKAWVFCRWGQAESVDPWQAC